MSNEMKLIMESWRKEILKEQQLQDCPLNEVTIKDIILGTAIAGLSDEQRKKIENLVNTNGADNVFQKIKQKIPDIEQEKSNVERLGTILKVGGLVIGAGTLMGIAMPAMPLLGAAALAGGGGAGVAAAAAGAGLTGAIAETVAESLMGKKEKEVFDNDDAKALLGLFCIDMKLLALLENKIQAQFISEQDVGQAIQSFLTTNPVDTELPDLNHYLLSWINSKNLTRTKVEPK